MVSTPPVFIASDVLQVGAQDVGRRSLAERRQILEELVNDAPLVLPCRRVVEECGYEGMVAKDPRSTYRPGPTRVWFKVKVRHDAVFAVGGIRDANAFDGVLVGEQVGDKLHYRGGR